MADTTCTTIVASGGGKGGEQGDDMASVPFASPLFGAQLTGARHREFGMSWVEQTFPCGAIRITTSDSGVTGLRTFEKRCMRKPWFTNQFVSSGSVHWFTLSGGEQLTAIELQIATTTTTTTTKTRPPVRGIRLFTNLRESPWMGATGTTNNTDGVVQHYRIQTPATHYIHTICGTTTSSGSGGILLSVGAYFVPLALRLESSTTRVMAMGKSPIIGRTPYTRDVEDSFRSSATWIRAVVVSITNVVTNPVVHAIRTLSETEYRRHLATRTTPLDANERLVVLATSERIQELHVVRNSTNEMITSLRFVTTLRTSEWFGAVPAAHAEIEIRGIGDKPGATLIGEFFGMRNGTKGIYSIGVHYFGPK